ncbi:MAG: hypothetical protein R2719_04330 [Micropruina sp.]
MLNILTITLVTALLALVTTNPGGEITAQILLSMAGMLLAQLAPFFDMAFLVSALTQDARAALGISVLGVVLAYGFAVTVEYIGSIDILGPISPFRYCARLRCPRGTNRRDAGHGRPHRRARHHPSGIETMERAKPPPEEQPHHPSSTPRRSHVGECQSVSWMRNCSTCRRQAAGARLISGITILGSPTRVSHDSYWPLVCLRQIRKVAVNAMPVAAKPSVASNERPSTMDSTPRASAITPEMAETNALVLARPVSFTLSSQVAVSTAGSRRNPIARRPSRGWIWPEVLARHCCGTTLTKLTIPVKMTW